MPLGEAGLRSILDQLPVAVVVADATGRVVYENTHAVDTLGHSVMNIEDLEAYGRLHAVDARGAPLAAGEYPLPRALRGETVPPTDYRYRRPDAGEVWLRAAASPIYKDGQVAGASVLFHNIDVERSATEKLGDAETALRESDRRKDQFLATLSHELRNPLAAIQFALPMLEGEPPAAARARAVIARQLAQVTRLVDDLAELSRISQGKIDLQIQPIEVAQFVAPAVETVRPRIDARRQVLRFDIVDAVRVHGDAQRLTQVVANLLGNASKYTDEGGQLTIAITASDGHAELRVRDTGVGIPKEMQPRIFDLFTQVDEHRHRSDGGLGLGLALVERLVHLHGGTVAVQSDGPGQGSEFTVRLPLADRLRS